MYLTEKLINKNSIESRLDIKIKSMSIETLIS